MTDEEHLKLSEWLDECPKPVIGRVLDKQVGIKYLLSTSHVYASDVLVCINLKELAKLQEAVQ